MYVLLVSRTERSLNSLETVPITSLAPAPQYWIMYTTGRYSVPVSVKAGWCAAHARNVRYIEKLNAPNLEIWTHIIEVVLKVKWRQIYTFYFPQC